MQMKSFLLLSLFIIQYSMADSQMRRYVVASDGSGDFKTVQQAFDAIDSNNKNPVLIFVKHGIYKEKLHLDSGKNYVTLVGENKDKTTLTFDDHTGKMSSTGELINTRTSWTFRIDANDFRAENITIDNNAGFSAGQAVALMINGDRCVFLNCRITGFQDTLFLSSENSRCYFRSCYIEGTTDFIFGAAIAWFGRCLVYSKKNSHITAASTPANHPFGFVFNQCRFIAADSVNKVTLGRPWRPYASVTYMNAYLANHIVPEGWDNWRNPENEKTARFAEYRNTGPGAKPSARVSWSRQLTPAQARNISMKTIFGDWNPHSKG